MLDDLAHIPSPIHRLDARVRVLVTLAVATPTALANRPAVLTAALAVSIGLVLLARLPRRALMIRLAGLNAFVLVLAVLLGATVPGPAATGIGPVAWSWSGLGMAGRIALRANAILLLATALLSTAGPVGLAGALRRLGAGRRLSALVMLTVRYVFVLHEEYLRLRTAMRLRGFRPGLNRHTYRSLGYLTGMLLLRSMDRAERVAEAMRLRGFRGEFYRPRAAGMSRRDAVFAAAGALLAVGLTLGEWL